MNGTCVFCEIEAGRAPAWIVGENELAFALLDIQPLARGHCLVVPRRHVQWWDEMTAEESDAVFRLARHTAERIRTLFAPDMVTMYARGRRVPHAHIFLVPTYAGDTCDSAFNALEELQERAPSLAGLRDPEELRSVWEALRDA